MPQHRSLDRVVSLALKPWALSQPMLSVVAAVLTRHVAGTAAAGELAEFSKRPAAEPQRSGGVAVIPLHGVLAPRMNAMSDLSGGTTFDAATAAVRDAMADPNVATIVLDWDSPGGSVAGCGEFAATLLAARDRKRIISHANFEMCSAAYWAGSCASEVVAAPSALVGSIGVYSIHEDLSAALAQHGISITYVSAGKFKVDGNDTQPLTDTARARLQAIVDGCYADFTQHVAAGRRTTVDAVRSGYGEGAVLTAAEALAAGLIDRIEPLDTTIAGAVARPQQLRAARARDITTVESALVALTL